MNTLPVFGASLQVVNKWRKEHGISVRDAFWLLSCWDYQQCGGLHIGFLGREATQGMKPLTSKDRLIKEGFIEHLGYRRFRLTSKGTSALIDLNECVARRMNENLYRVKLAKRAYENQDPRPRFSDEDPEEEGDYGG